MTTTNKPDFATLVMDKIESEHIKTYSRLWFVAHDVLFWVCWFISALFGALALAATLYILTSLDAKMYLITHDSIFTYLFDVLPYVWMISFALMCVVAHINLRHTPRGYKYSTWLLVLLNMSVTIILALLLFVTGLGRLLDEQAGAHIPHYQPAAVRQEMRWFRPESGLLIGQVIYVNDATRYFVLESPQATEYPVDGRLLSADEWLLLEMPSMQVRVIGMPESESTFVACVVLPALSATSAPLDEGLRERLFHGTRSIECKGVRPYERFDEINHW
ncbi:MAG: hypothetical protein QG626_295 [Patescibacteria group bacterium]|jgi:hypothetical protein|nr:hypothetical protein [Patescibacteria group bacterium]